MSMDVFCCGPTYRGMRYTTRSHKIWH